jgi:glycosyltransferase involved in cell wall biosynthesis
MRILLTANASYLPPRGGATRSNLIWMDHLAGAGHECRVVCATLAPEAGGREQLRQEGIAAAAESGSAGIERARRGSIAVCSVAEPARRVHALRDEIARFQPDWVLVSSEDLGHTLLREAHHSAPGRVVYLAHTPQFFPFGPASWNPDPHGAELVRASAGVVVIGQAMARYVEAALGRSAAVVHPPLYGEGPFADRSSFDRGLVTMINPCAVKGIALFLEIAAAFPGREFGYIPGWGTTADDRRALAQLPNIRALPNVRDIDELFAQTRVLLMPSLWYEGFGLIVMEAMLRAIPVIASDAGGLVEAKEGTGYVIPTHGIERYREEFDERAMPRPVLPVNPIEPWCQALAELLTDRAAYQAEAERSRRAALRFVGGLDAGRLEAFLLGLRPAAGAAAPAASRPGVESLSPAQRALLLQRLRQRKAGGC